MRNESPNQSHIARIEQWGKSIVVGWATISLVGCAALGVKPEKIDFEEDAITACSFYHDDRGDRRACADYERVYLWATKLKTTYLARARANEWAIYIGGTLAIASVGALAGLAAFGEAGSDAAKIIPLAGGFLGGLASFFNHDQKADAYHEAEQEIDVALIAASATVTHSGTSGRDAKKYNVALTSLESAVSGVEKKLERTLRSLRSDAFKFAQEKKELERTVKLARLAAKYSVVGIPTVNAGPPRTLTITLNRVVEDTDKSLLAEVSRVQIDDDTVTSIKIQGNQVSIDVPAGVAAGPHAVRFMIDEHEKSNRPITLP